MIKFKNINGDVFLAVGSIKRKSALNGEKSLTGTLFEGDDVLNKIDKGWSLEFDNEPYVVTYFERNDNDNTVEFDAIHKFFWDMNKSVLYSSASGSHTAKWYLDQIFNGTGYTYALNFDPSAFEKENWGMKNKLSLFNDAISGMGGEFEINGTLVSIFKNIGSDLSTIVRHGFNLSDMSLENDNTDFVTYGEGFGAYADQENQTGERLHVTYTSPLAKTFGKLHAEPIDDQRYTIKDNLLQAIKDKVDGSFAISIKLSLYDLTAAGYPYKMANVGDWLLAIDENLDFKQKIRIISVDDEFATDGTRISYTVTCGDIGVVQKYQQANASLGQKVDSAYQNAQDAKASSIQAVIAANGKNTTRWFDSKEEMDAFKANEGDMAFLRTGDGEAMYIYTKMPDGSFKWVKRVDPDTGEQIAAGVDLAIETAQSQAAAMDEVRASEAAVFQSEANAALSSGAAERAAFSSNAVSMANSASAHADTVANSASAYAKAQAASALSSANLELANAKQELGSEVSKAQSDITATNQELAGKVSQTEFDNTTGDLTTKYGQVKATADAVTTDVANYKIANDKKVSANTASIETLDNQITSKVSQTDYDKETKDLEGKYSETKQTVDSISNTVTELQAKANAQGQVNQLLNTEFTPDFQSWTQVSTAYRTTGNTRNGSNVVKVVADDGDYLYQDVPVSSGVVSFSSIMEVDDGFSGGFRFAINFRDSNYAYISADGTNWGTDNTSALGYTLQKVENIAVPDGAAYVRINYQFRGTGVARFSQPMLVFSDHVGTYVQGNYNNNARVAALEVDLDSITGLVNDPKKGLSATATLAANGLSIATKAQSEATIATQTAQGTQTTVTNVQKDVKDLQSKTTQTAGQVTTEIEDRKNGDKSVRTDMANLIDQRVSSVTNGYQSAISQSANAIMASVSTPNQLLNTEFNPDLEGWSATADIGSKAPYRSYWNTHNQATVVAFNTTTGASRTSSRLVQNVQLASTTSAGNSISLSWSGRATQLDNYANLWVIFYDTSGNRVSVVKTKWVATADGSWNDSKWENISVPDTATSMGISFEAREGTVAYLSHPMLVFGSTIGDTYMPGSYSGMNTSTVLELFKDNWALGIADNAGRLISGINGDTSNTRIVGKQIILDGDTTVTGDFYAKGGNFQNLNASNFTGGTLNAAKVNVINIDASNISGGLIRGIDMEAADINMYNDNSKIHGDYDWTDQDEAIFPRRYVGNWNLGKRRLEFYGDVTPNDATNDGGKYSSYTYFGLDSIKMRRLFATGNLNRTLDINAGKGEIYIRKRDNEQQDMNANISVIEAGKTQLRGDNSDLIVSTNKILGDTNIRNTVELSSGNDNSDAFIQSYNVFGKRFNPPKDYEENVWMYFYPDSSDTYYGLGLLRGDKVSQGFLSSTWAYNNTYSYSSNMYITSNGNIGRATSASKYKLDITHYDDLDRANKLLSIKPASWFDKSATEQYVDELNGGKESIEKIPVKPHYGLIAEDLVEAGLEEFVSYDTNTGEVEGLEYDRVWTVLIPLIKNMKQRIDQLEKGK